MIAILETIGCAQASTYNNKRLCIGIYVQASLSIAYLKDCITMTFETVTYYNTSHAQWRLCSLICGDVMYSPPSESHRRLYMYQYLHTTTTVRTLVSAYNNHTLYSSIYLQQQWYEHIKYLYTTPTVHT